MARNFWSLTRKAIHQLNALFSNPGTPRSRRRIDGYSGHTYM